jgi:hypothetical protein
MPLVPASNCFFFFTYLAQQCKPFFSFDDFDCCFSKRERKKEKEGDVAAIVDICLHIVRTANCSPIIFNQP